MLIYVIRKRENKFELAQINIKFNILKKWHQEKAMVLWYQLILPYQLWYSSDIKFCELYIYVYIYLYYNIIGKINVYVVI